MDELIIEIDKNNNKIGLRLRSEFYSGNYIHRSAHLILVNSKNEILLQQRTKDKKWYPNLYTFSVAGTVGDESYDECIKREMREEIGIDIPIKKLFIYYADHTMGDAFRAVYFGQSDEKISPDQREIQSIKWVDAEILKLDIIKNPDIYTPLVVKGLGIFFNEYYN